MATYRTQVRIVADVLTTAKDFGEDGRGVRISTLLRKANMSYGRLMKLVRELVSSGLLEELEASRGSKYKISGAGLEFLMVYDRFQEFASTFGLRL